MKRSRIEELIMNEEGLERLDRKTLEEIQLKKLNAVLAREQERHGFYQLPASLSSLSELSSLPFTTADDLRKHYTGLFLGSSSEVAKVMTERTSGTTGEAKRIFYSDTDLQHTIALFTAGIGEMAGEGDRVMICMPYTGPNSLADLIAGGVRGCGAEPVQMQSGSLFEQCRQFHEVKPSCAIDMPVALLARARCYEYLYGKGSFPLRAALPSADAISKAVEDALQDEFGLTLFQHYGSREMGLGGAITCEAHEGMHLREHQVIAEIIDEEGNPLPDGEWGELVITTVGMQVLPLIRFRTGDHTRFLKDPCPCGSVTRRLDRVCRKGSDAELLETAENCCFPDPSVIDLSLRRQASHYEIGLLVLPDADLNEMRKKADELFPDGKAELSVSTADQNSVLLYAGKRSVL